MVPPLGHDLRLIRPEPFGPITASCTCGRWVRPCTQMTVGDLFRWHLNAVKQGR